MSPIEFPDVSYHQGSINWATMATKTKNVVIRSSQGNWADSAFSINYSSAKVHGIKRSIYHFFDDRYHPDEQVKTIVNLIKNDLPESRVWIDWENLSYHTNSSYKGLANVVRVMKGIESAFPGIVVGMYTGYYWFIEHSNYTANYAEYEYLKSHPLWIAAYPNIVGIPNPPWKFPPELHQYGTPVRGHEFGCESLEIDMNMVMDNFEVYSGNPEPPTTGGKMLGKVLVALNIRKQPNSDNTTNPAIGQLKAGDIVEADFETNGWWHLTKITRAGVGVALPSTECYAYEGSNNGYIQDITPPPTGEPLPPREVTILDENGILWKSTTFTRV